MKTSVDDVYAAGDISENNGWVIAILPLATKQGKKAGYNMAGGKKTFKGGIPMNAVELCHIPTISVGLTDPKENPEEYEILEKYKPRENLYRKIVLKDNIIKGVIFVSEIDRAGIFTGMIKDELDVSTFKQHLLKDDFGLISLPKDYRKKHFVKGESIEI
jgi:NAD(P)H-nitrite reductase large subunit